MKLQNSFVEITDRGSEVIATCISAKRTKQEMKVNITNIIKKLQTCIIVRENINVYSAKKVSIIMVKMELKSFKDMDINNYVKSLSGYRNHQMLP